LDCKKVPRALKRLVYKYIIVLEPSVIVHDFQESGDAKKCASNSNATKLRLLLQARDA